MDISRFPGHDGGQLAYRETGGGRPLILLHGFMGTGSGWLDRGPADTLAAHGFRLVLPDLRGHRDSARSPSSSTSGSAPASTTSAVTRSAAGSWCACSPAAPGPAAPSSPGRGWRR